MKIIVLGPAHPYRGGIAAFDERLARQFMAEGHDVEVYTFTLQYPNFLFPGKTQYTSEPNAPKDLKISRRINSCNPLNWISVGKEISKKNADILAIAFWLPFMAPCFGTISRLARKNGKTKVVGVLHNLIPHEPRIFDKTFARYFCSSIDGFIALSKSVLEDINKFEAKKPKLFSPHPLYDHFGEKVSKDEACQRLNLDPNKKYLLFFGLIRDYKGLDWLLEAFANSGISDKGYRLIIAGEFYSHREKYISLAESLHIINNIEWRTEFVPDEEVKFYFGVADLIVQPYKSATQSGVTQIAYHFEKPMLVTKVGGLPEIVPDGKAGYVVEPNPEAIASALSDFCENARDFSEGVRDEKKKYSWHIMCQAIFKLWETK